MLFNNKLIIIALIIWFGCFSGNYIIMGVGIYPPLFLSIFGYILIIKNKKLPKYSLFFLNISWIYILLFSISYLYNQEYFNVFIIEIRYVVKAILIPLGTSLLLLHLFKKYNIQKNEIAFSVIIAISLQFILILLQLTNDSFREWFFSYLSLSDGWMHFVKIGHFRTVGLSGLSIYDTALAYTLLFGLTIYLTDNKYNSLMIWTFGTAMFFIIILLSGRSGLTIFLVLLIFILLNINNKLKIYSSLFLVTIITFFIISVYVDYEKIELFFRFAFELFTNDSNSFESASTNDFLENHLFIPWDVNPYFGDGVIAQPSISIDIGYQYSTDSGYLLSFISLGIIGLLLSLIMTYKVINAYFISYFYHFKTTILNVFFKTFISILIILIFFKGIIFFSDKFMPVVILIFMVNHYLSNRRFVSKI